MTRVRLRWAAAARYVRVFATQRCRRDDGYALNEFEVYGTKADTSPPTVPGNLRPVQISPISVTLAWDASTDDTGVAGYDVRSPATRSRCRRVRPSSDRTQRSE